MEVHAEGGRICAREEGSNLSNVHIRTWGDSGERIILLHGSNVPNPEITWSEQRPLSDRFQLVVVDRPGHGQSPPYQGPGFEAGIADIVDLLGDEGGHLIGSSYGGVMAMLAAGRRPGLVRSLTVIEPPAFRIVRGNPEVEALLGRLIPVYEQSQTPEEFIRGFAGAFGEELPADLAITDPLRIKAIRTAMTEPPPWTADILYEVLRAGPFPKLVLSGNWYPAFEIACNAIAAAMGAEREIFEGSGHGAQRTGKRFNDRWLRLVSPG